MDSTPEDRRMPLRLAAGAVALVAWVGLAVQLHATLEWTGSVSTAVWALLRYFTIIANLAVAVVLTAVATGAPGCSPGLLGGVTLVVALVGAVYAVLLRGLIELSGADSLADTVLHVATPVLAPLFWLFFAPKGGLSYRDPWVWAGAAGNLFCLRAGAGRRRRHLRLSVHRCEQTGVDADAGERRAHRTGISRSGIRFGLAGWAVGA